jgi:hypothetical protein
LVRPLAVGDDVIDEVACTLRVTDNKIKVFKSFVPTKLK